MNVSLPDQMHGYVDQPVEGGRYGSTNEYVLQEHLDLLQDERVAFDRRGVVRFLEPQASPDVRRFDRRLVSHTPDSSLSPQAGSLRLQREMVCADHTNVLVVRPGAKSQSVRAAER